MSMNDVRPSRKGSLDSPDNFNTADYLSWRRLHLSKSKLKGVAEMSSFMAGFAVVATVELQINEDSNPPLLTAFVITTALLVGTCMIAIIISTCILPHLEAVTKMSKISAVNQSPHDKMMRLIDISWVLTNSASLFFFTLDVILMCWIKFTFFSRGASIAATVIMAPVLVIIVAFAIIFYRRIVKHQYVISSMKYEELEVMQKELERASSVYSMSNQVSITSNNNRKFIQHSHSNHHSHRQLPHYYHPHPHNHSPHASGSQGHHHHHDQYDSVSMYETPLSPTMSNKSFPSSVFTV